MTKPSRLTSIDMLRGFVIALMALDHTRDFFAPTPFDPLDLALGSPGWYWTRWITNLCAPTFVLLAGSSAFLRGLKGDTAELSRYLLSRGAMLILLEMTWISFSWQFGFNVIILQVIWALGAGMMFLGLLVWLPLPAIAMIGAALILPHNLLDLPDGAKPGVLMMAWHHAGFLPLPGNHGIVFRYPLMPWLGLIAAGYALGPVFRWEAARRQRFLLLSAAGLMLAFVLLRATNWYGNFKPWLAQGRGWAVELMAFIDVEKYPPSLLYLCVTVSIALMLLVAMERVKPVPLLLLFGRTPMFFYVVHVALIHLLGIVYLSARFGSMDTPRGLPLAYVPSLLVCYVAWLAMLALMYWLTQLWCNWRAARASAPAPA
ncbi:MAG: heparan-alpha-glucosaminide N-acetyltransferase domain-containing protein [Pseudomonadota bacterium]